MTEHGDSPDRTPAAGTSGMPTGSGPPGAEPGTMAALRDEAEPQDQHPQPPQATRQAQQSTPQEQPSAQPSTQQEQQSTQQAPQSTQQPQHLTQPPTQQSTPPNEPLHQAAQQSAQQPPQPAQPESHVPSPYLEAGQSVPQAYPAPAQPGMPPYGSGRGPFRPGQVPLGFGQQPAGQQANGQQFQQPYGQPPGRQRPYGGPGPGGRPASGMGTRPRRDPALAAGWERLVASLLDWVLILFVSVLAFLSPLTRIWRALEHIANGYSSLTSPAAQTAVENFARSPSTLSTLLHFWLAVFAIALAYFWVMHAVWGATLGKRALGVAVVMASDRAKIGVREAGIRAVAFLVGPAIFVLIARVGYFGGILWLSDNGILLFDARAQCLHDKLAGTVVIKRRRLQQPAQPRPW